MTAATSPEQAELMRSPRHPSPRRAIWVILALFTMAMLWACVGQVDIVAVAHGRIVVSEGTKLIQPLEISVVQAIHVKNGDKVNAGQLLIELDSTTAQADNSRVAQGRVATLSEVWRTQALLGLLDNGKAPSLPKEAGDIDDDLRQLAQSQLDSEWRNIRAQRAGQDRTQLRIEVEQDLAAYRARREETKAAITQTEQTRRAWVADTDKTLNERRAKADLQQRQSVEEGAKAGLRERLTRLTALVSGPVQQLAVHTTGGVVTRAQVTADVTLENKDGGFVSQGQEAQITLETFPYTRYGMVSARGPHITAGAVFPATLTLAQQTITVDGRHITLAPGMNLTAEIPTGKRRVIDYLLSLVRRQVTESRGINDL